jgi:nicotinamide-nucleotide amidase
MDIEIVTIGDELLLGFTIDTNAAHLARELASAGVRVVRRASVGDGAEMIADAVREAMHRTGGVITTGGLGPTADDRSKAAIAALFGQRMVLNEPILERLKARWLSRFGRELPVSNHQQAMMPEHAVILENRHGSAPGVWMEDADGRWVAMLPGVPREMRGMLADTLMPRLLARTGAEAQGVVRSRTLRTTSIAESALADRLGGLARGVDGMPLAFLPGVEGVDLRLTSTGRSDADTTSRLDAAAAQLIAIVGDYVYGEGSDDLAALVLSQVIDAGGRIAVAESCTGGLLGGRLTAVPGSSAAVLGGIIAYDNSVKMRELGVSAVTLEQHGAVSESVALQMATAVRERFGATIGLAVTGVSGPGGGTEEKPVGTTWVAVDVEGTVEARRSVFFGDRAENRARAAQQALDMLRRRLAGLSAPGARGPR